MSDTASHIFSGPNLLEFERVIARASATTLVVFDIDEVIFTSKDQVLNPNYKKYRDIFEQALTENFSEKEIIQLISLIYKMRQRIVVDPKVLEILKSLLSHNIMTIALTHCPTGEIATGDKYEELRIAQLESFGMDFDLLSKHLNEIRLPELEEDHGVPLLYKGVILTGLVDKGTVLAQILEKIDFKPKEIIFIDYRIENIISVQTICLKHKIKFTGFEYTAVKDGPLSEFIEKRARLQFETLAEKRIWLSDSEADIRLKANL